MQTLLRRLFVLVALATLAACGGGSGSTTPPFGGTPPGGGNGGNGGGTPTPTAADIDLQLSSATIFNSGEATVTATVTALDANRNAVAGVPVTLSADSGAVVTIAGTIGSVTDASGRVTATIAVGADRSNRTITVTASASGVTRSAALQVVDAPTGTVPTSIEVIASATTVGTGGDAVTVRAFVKDANNNALPNAPVAFRASTGTLSAVTTTTDAAGVATAQFAAGADRSNRSAVITVSSGAVSSALALPIAGTRLTLSGPTSLILGNSAAFDVVVTDAVGNPVPGVAVTATSSLGNPLVTAGDGRTNASGQIRYTYTATNPGTDSVVFAGAGSQISPSPALTISGEDFTFVSPAAGSTVAVGAAQKVRVRLLQGGVGRVGATIDFAATGGTLSGGTVSASTSTTNSAGEAEVTLTSLAAGPVTVQATVRGSSTSTTLPLTVVATVPTNLVLQISPTAIGPNASIASGNQAQVVAKVTDLAGNPVQGQTVNFTRVTDPSGGNLLQASATTDASGQASVAYRSGSESTANNGVVLRAQVAGYPGVADTATLTVNQAALFIALGTGNVIENLDPQTYRKNWVVYVTDSNGIAVNGATVTVKAIPIDYLTGRLAFDGTSWTGTSPIWACRNEDANENGILDPGEDDNGDGVLWPGNVIAVSPGTVQTVDGRATVSLTYAESYAPWIRLRLTASATVAGTESRTDVEFVVVGLAADFTDEAIPPAGRVSPFGVVPKAPALATPGACAMEM